MNDNTDSDSVDDLIVSLNFFIFPDRKKYKYVEFILLLFSFAFLCLIISNIFEVYFKHEFSYEIPISKQPGYVKFRYHFWITTFSAAIGLFWSLRLFKSTQKHLFHSRNLLILLRWYDSLRSAMFFTFEKHNEPLVKGRNFVEYREYRSDNELQLVFTVQKKSKLKSDAL